ncbi:MAG: ABC transporter permease [Parvibaculaceae bacterium]
MNPGITRPAALLTRAFSSRAAPNTVLFLCLIGLVALFSTQSESFLTWSNFKIILTNDAAIGIVVAACTLLIIAGHIDLSVGSNMAFSGTLAALAVVHWGLPDGLAMAIGVMAGMTVGAVNGLLCALLRMNPIIVTLGMLSVLRGLILLVIPTDIYGLGDLFNYAGNGEIAGIPILLIAVALAFGAAAVFVGATVWGRHIYALGVNPQAAFFAGLPVRGLPFALYVLTGTAAGSAGVLLVARLDGSSPGSVGLQMELQVLTIILLGGVAFAGGTGRIVGVVTAWIFLGVLRNGLTLLNVTPYFQLVVSGLALVLAAAFDSVGSTLLPWLDRRRAVRLRLGSPPRASHEGPKTE